MKAVEYTYPAPELEWDSVAITRTDFRPNWDGDLVNLASMIHPTKSELETATIAKEVVRQIAAWVAANKRRFGVQDRFQIILGWPKSVREFGRQIVKIGGPLDVIEEIASGIIEVRMRPGWEKGIFKNDQSPPNS